MADRASSDHPGVQAQLDRLADEVGDGSLRLTTRQGVQYHFVHKGELKPLIGALNRRMVNTWAACGDVVRNTMFASAPVAGRCVRPARQRSAVSSRLASSPSPPAGRSPPRISTVSA